MDKIVQQIYNIVWSPALIILLVGAGLYFTLRTRCVQIRRIGEMVRLLFKKPKGKEREGISSFQAFCIALSGRVGTGNIVGVATAIALGGPGAVFWMWVIAFLGASTAFMESTLAQKYKFKRGSEWRGGPASYIDEGLGCRWLGIVFAIFTIIGYGMLLAMVQANGVASAFDNSFSINPLWTGIGVVVLLAVVIVGGVRRIADFASVVTPFMALGYILMSLIIIGANIKAVPAVFGMIFSSAFGFNSAFGGIIGSAISMGVKRGLFSNEAGQGGGAIVSASANVDNPAQQGLVQAFSVYIDTILVCTSTALIILCTGCYNIFGADGRMIASNAPELGSNYVGFTQAAIDTVFNGVGSAFVAIALAFFTFTTLIAYYFYSESSILYIARLKGRKSKERMNILVYRILLFAAVVYGACTQSDTVWTIGDIGLGLTTWINVIVLLILCPQALKDLKEYEATLPRRGRRR